MVRIDRRLFANATLVGVLATLLVAAAGAMGLLAPMERWFYDQRALHCQRWTPAPTTQLVHVDIDGPSLDAIGRWPWDRADLADLLDEIGAAGPKAVALDVLLSEPQKTEAGKTSPDERLATAIKRLGNCVVAASFPFRPEQVGPVYGAVLAELSTDAELGEAEVVEALRRKGIDRPDLPSLVHEDFHAARRQALFQRIVTAGEGTDAEALQAALLPRTDPLLETSASNAFRAAYAQAQAARALRQLAVPPPGPNALVAGNELDDAPLAPFSRAAAGAGFVDYPQSADGKVRSVPLLLAHDGKAYPQLGLALAWATLGVRPQALNGDAGSVVVPRGHLGDLRVPVRTLDSAHLLGVGKDVPLAADVSWFGGADWATMYDPPGYRVPRQHVPMTALWDAVQIRRRIALNNENAERTMANMLPDELYEEFALKPLPHDDVDGYAGRIDRLIAAAQAPPAGDARRDEFDGWVRKLRAIRQENPRLRDALNAHRATLRPLLADKAVLVGWTATGVAADFFPTPLHPRCPGVVLHGVVFNQVMTGEAWRRAPGWLNAAVTVGIGLVATLAVTALSPSKALAAAATLAAGYLGLNGFLLFDYGNTVVAAAGPVVATGGVFAACTLAKLVLERRERARITRRFSSYVDPKIVEYVVKHPDLVHFEGQIREMTVVFCDVAGFTNLTETHGSETVVMLNALWGVMVPVIRRNGGIVNKFLGDGIMFFYGAPEQSPNHARDAVATVLAMRKALEEFNRTVVAARKWPPLGLRWGVSTGTMVVGDAGSGDTGSGSRAADYTVLGDNVNLGSRLEGANKAVGTDALVTDRTVELAKDAGVLFRPIGRLRVVGKREGVMAYEPVARLPDATEEQKRLAAETQAMVDAFTAGQLAECVTAANRMDAAHGSSKLTALYRERCEWFLRESSEPFDGQIVLTEK